MATIPNPKTWVANEKPTAAGLNLEIRDALNFLLNPPQCSAYRSGALSAANNTQVLVPLDAEVFDTDVMHDLSTNPSRMIAKTAGKYLVTAGVTFPSNATGVRGLVVEKNAAGVQGGGMIIGQDQLTIVGIGSAVLSVATQVVLAANDYLEIFVRQTSGAALAVTPGERLTFIEMLWVGI